MIPGDHFKRGIDEIVPGKDWKGKGKEDEGEREGDWQRR